MDRMKIHIIQEVAERKTPTGVSEKFFFLCQINLSSTRFKKKDVSLCGRRPLSIGDVFTVTGRQSA
jgi:hypothetical protein